MISLVFTKSSSFIGSVIRLFTGGIVTHVGIRLDNGKYIHADSGGVKLSTKKEFLGSDRTIYAIFSAKNNTATLFDEDAAMKCIGRKYDYDGLLGFIPILIFKDLFGVKIKNPFADKKEYICSEFVISPDIWKRRKLIEEFRGDPESVSPAELYKRLREGHSFTIDVSGTISEKKIQG